MTVLCNYDIIKGTDDLLGKALSVLKPCFPWAVFQLKATEKGPTQPVKAPMIPLDQMNTLFQAEAIAKIDTARTSFSGRVIRGEIREGDVLNITDGTGQQICPPGVVRAIFLKDRVENGKVVGERCSVLSKDKHADSLLLAVEIPKGSYNGIILSKKEGISQTKKPVGVGLNAASCSPSSGEECTDSASKSSFFSRIFGKRKAYIALYWLLPSLNSFQFYISGLIQQTRMPCCLAYRIVISVPPGCPSNAARSISALLTK